MDLQALWETLLVRLREDIDAEELEVWFRDARPTGLHDDVLEVEVANRYYAAWIQDNYIPMLRTHGRGVFGSDVRYAFVTPDDSTAELQRPTPVAESAAPRRPAAALNANQSFDTFVVGECNKLAHAAALAVADKPANAYNPLYIYGPTGLGKTHLMHAIGHEIQRHRPGARVIYVTAEDFTNEMINSIRHKRTDDFRAKYREEADVLLVDDIQFLSGKERTQEEFFFTFNTMQASNRQIVLTSDVEPKDIKALTPRLRTRFEGGLIADMQAPDPETLLAILHKKADATGFTLPEDLAEAIAGVAQGNVRELEGIINRLGALVKVYDEPLTLDFARRHMPKLFSPEPPVVTVAAIIEAVARFFNLKSADITGKGRARTLTHPRHIAMYLGRRHTRLSFPELGREFGRDHTTIQHGVKKVEAEADDDPETAYQIRLIEQSLGLRVR